MGVTLAHGSYPHQAPGYATSGPVGATPGGRFGTAEVDAFAAPWECLRDDAAGAVDNVAPPAMRVLALQPRMRWPGDCGAQHLYRAHGVSAAADARSDDAGHPTDEEDDSTQGRLSSDSSADTSSDDTALGSDDDTSASPSESSSESDAESPSDRESESESSGALTSRSTTSGAGTARRRRSRGRVAVDAGGGAAAAAATAAATSTALPTPPSAAAAREPALAHVIPDAITHAPLVVDVTVALRAPPRGYDPSADPRGLPAHKPFEGSAPRRVPYGDHAYYCRIFRPVKRWATDLIYDVRTVRSRAGAAKLSADAISAIYSGAVTGLRRAAVNNSQETGQCDPSQIPPHHAASAHRKHARALARQLNRCKARVRKLVPDLDAAGLRALLDQPDRTADDAPSTPPVTNGAVGAAAALIAAPGGASLARAFDGAASPSTQAPQSLGADLAQLAVDARVARLARCARLLARQWKDSQRLARRAARKATAEALDSIIVNLESQRRTDPSKFFRDINRLTHNHTAAPIGHGHLPAPPFGAVVAYALELFTENRPPPGVLLGGWDRDMPQLPPPPSAASAFPPSGIPATGAEHNAYVAALERDVYLHLFPVTCASARDYKAPCADPAACPLCSDFGERIGVPLCAPVPRQPTSYLWPSPQDEQG